MCEGSGVPRRLEVLLELRRLPVVGRSVDLRALLAARLVKLFRANAEYLVSRFEASPLSGVVELESQVGFITPRPGAFSFSFPFSPLLPSSASPSPPVHSLSRACFSPIPLQAAVLQRAHELLGDSAPLGDWSALWAKADKPEDKSDAREQDLTHAQGASSRVSSSSNNKNTTKRVHATTRKKVLFPITSLVVWHLTIAFLPSPPLPFPTTPRRVGRQKGG